MSVSLCVTLAINAVQPLLVLHTTQKHTFPQNDPQLMLLSQQRIFVGICYVLLQKARNVKRCLSSGPEICFATSPVFCSVADHVP